MLSRSASCVSSISANVSVRLSLITPTTLLMPNASRRGEGSLPRPAAAQSRGAVARKPHNGGLGDLQRGTFARPVRGGHDLSDRGRELLRAERLREHQNAGGAS